MLWKNTLGCIVTQRKYDYPLLGTVTLWCAHLLQMLFLSGLLFLLPRAAAPVYSLQLSSQRKISCGCCVRAPPHAEDFADVAAAAL